MEILVVENNIKNANAVKEKLLKLFPKCNVKKTCDPLLAVKAVLRSKPDLILFNCRLKYIDGFHMASILDKQNCKFKGIVLTEDDRYFEKAKSMGFGYIEYPLSSEQLRSVVNHIFHEG